MAAVYATMGTKNEEIGKLAAVEYDNLIAHIDHLEQAQDKPSGEVFEDLIQTMERNTIDNKSTISNVKLWAKSWRKEMEIMSEQITNQEQEVKK